jgi:hypothetical protein
MSEATVIVTQLRGNYPGKTTVVRAALTSPEGPSAAAAVVPATENLAGGDLVNVWVNGGVLSARRASAAQAGYEASGFVLEAVTAGQNATVYWSGRNARAGMTVGRLFLSTTPGSVQSSPPTGQGQVVQPVGHALSATVMMLQLGVPIRLA